MTTNTTVIAATPTQVWDVLADGWLYPLWVVGATRMRDVDESWPGVGAQLHHSAGAWPLVINDQTKVLESEPPRFLRLRAEGGPLGEAEVRISLEATGAETRVVLEEKAVAGPGALVPRVIHDPLIKFRNTETLDRLRMLVEGRTKA